MTDELTALELSDMTQCEAVIAQGLRTFVDVGNALLKIRDGRLYRREYWTFEEYCEKRWGFSNRRANQFIEAATTIATLGTVVPELAAPTAERQVRPLTSLPPAQQAEAWQRAVDTAPEGKITAAHVQAVVDDMRQPRAEPMSEAEILSAAQRIKAGRTEVRRAERIEQILTISDGNRPLTAPTLCNVLLVDPPWRYDYAETESRAIENHYPTMTAEELAVLPIHEVAAPDCVLFMWATSPKLGDALQLIAEWGFNYRTCMVWVKDKIGMGYYARQRHELLLIAARGAVPVPLPENRPDSVIEAPRTEHSAKPEYTYTVIERMYSELPKLEMFARQQRDGWQTWGNQDGA